MTPKYPEDLSSLVAYLKKLPGVGVKTAERFAFEFLSWPSEQLNQLSALLRDFPLKVPSCSECGCLMSPGQCRFCDRSTRESHTLCILASPRDVYAIEETRTYRGLYHVIEHLLSPLDGRHAAEIRVDRIEQRIETYGVKEIILAFDSTLEGDTTALYLKQQLAKQAIPISRLAFGLPVGSSLEYIDGGTLARALAGRQTV